MKKYKYILILLAIIPTISFAALGGLKDLVGALGDIINSIIPVMFGLALVYFFWGLAKFISNAGEEKAREEGRQKMLWGIVALFVFVSIFGILRWLGNTLDIRPEGFTPSGFSTGGSGTPCPSGSPMAGQVGVPCD